MAMHEFITCATVGMAKFQKTNNHFDMYILYVAFNNYFSFAVKKLKNQ